jgi:arylsulfatase A-like enzyme
MAINLSVAAITAVPVAVHAQQVEEMAKKPNIILFMVDDMGWEDTSLPFWTQRTKNNNLYETPNMERLAREGMMFTQAYASSISSPSRCSLLTGANAARHRVTNWTLEKNKKTDASCDTLTLPDWNYNGISQVEGTNNTFVGTSFVQLLHNSGYYTIHCGKAHFGAIDTPGEDPHHFGFDVNIAGHAAGGPASYLGEDNYGNKPDKNGKISLFAIPGLERYWGTDTFLSEALTQEALRSLDKAKKYGQPFFLYMAHYAIHVPINRDMRFYQKYRDKGMSEKEAAYAALIEGMDKSLGEIMDWLENNKMVDNTIVLFMSDNGGYCTGTHWRDAPLYTQNYPLSCGKGSAREGGIREPMIVRWPGVVKPGTKCDKYLLIEDFYPTILEMAGIRHYKVPQQIDGISFMPLLRQTGDPSKGRSLFWNCPNIWGEKGPGTGPTCTVRKGDWKLIYYYATGEKELFNITEDISETKNLAGTRPDIVRKLSSELGGYLRKVGGQRPTFTRTGKPCPWPDEK